MRSPWLDIPLADYEGHMSLPAIGRADMLAAEFAALVLEYVEPLPVLRNLRAICRPQGILATVLQLPSAAAASNSDSPFASLQGLAPAMRLVSPDVLTATAVDAGFVPIAQRRFALASGKEFVAQVFQAQAREECR